MDALSDVATRVGLSTHISAQIFKDIWLEWHVYVDRAQYPTELGLDDVEDSCDVHRAS